MSVNTIVPSSIISNVGTKAIANPKTQLSQQDFLKLLVTQLKLQSPTNPFDSNTMMQQMSQLTALGASAQLEKTVNQLGNNLNSTQVLTASQIVGKQVQVPAEFSTLTANEGLTGSILLPSNVSQATVTIRDANDKPVKTIELGPMSVGVSDFKWNGLDSENKMLEPGLYKISASTMIDGESKPLKTAGLLKVNSVSLDPHENAVLLDLDGMGRVNLSNVIKIL